MNKEPSEDLVDIKHAVLRIRTLRIASLIVFFLLLNAVLFGFQPIPLLLPVLQSMGNPATTTGDAFAALQYTLWEPAFPWLPLASFLIVVLLLGRATCSWVCPFGFVQEIIGWIKRKHTQISPRTHRDMIYVKYIVLGAVLLLSITLSAMEVTGMGRSYKNALGPFAQAPFDALSPHDTLFATLPTLASRVYNGQAPFNDYLTAIPALSLVFWTRLFILGLVLVLAFFVPRSWCSYVCPVGAIMALLNYFSFLGLKRDVVKCTKESCRKCVEVCPMKVPILDLPWEKFTHPECIYCLECVDACKTKVIKLKFP
jgi:ferredoxin-type protein NapH